MENRNQWDIYENFIFKLSERRAHDEQKAEFYRNGETVFCRQMADQYSLSASCYGWVINGVLTAVREGKTPIEALTEVRNKIDQRKDEVIAEGVYHPSAVEADYAYFKGNLFAQIMKMEKC